MAKVKPRDLFKRGDLVRLKSGSTLMVVHRDEADDGLEQATVIWQAKDGDIKMSTLDVHVLEREPLGDGRFE